MVYFLCKAYDSDRQNCYFALSLPVRGAWVEMPRPSLLHKKRAVSLPVRGAWVEINQEGLRARKGQVAPRAGSVG